jgi:hypothetical protein
MKQSKTTDLIECALAADVPILLWGAPGIGKTAMVEEVAEKRGAHLETLIGSTMDPTDLARPFIDDGKYKMSPPPWVDRLTSATAEGKQAILFLDELTCAPGSIQAALLRVVQSRMVCDVSIKRTKIVAAANPVEYAADGVDLSPATLNRWTHIDVVPDADDWIAGELGGWGNADPRLSDVRARVTGWIAHSRSALLAPPKDGDASHGWPSPRSWSNVCRLGSSSPEQLVAGLVGSGAATEYFTWAEAQDLPDPEKVLNGTARLPERGDQHYVVLCSCLSYAVSRPVALPMFWELLIKCRKDTQAIFARRGIKALSAARVQYDIPPSLVKIAKGL